MLCSRSKSPRRRTRKYVRPRCQLIALLVLLSVICGVRISKSSRDLPSDPQNLISTTWKQNAAYSLDIPPTHAVISFNGTSIASQSISPALLKNDSVWVNSEPLRYTESGRNNSRASTFTFCLLIKDDNDILNEWLAYHYHTINLRYVIVAIDPSSKTSPSSIFDRWKRYFGLESDIWTDSDYMPEYFLRGQYDQVPSFLPDYIKRNISASHWHATAGITDSNRIRQDLQHINNHRFRQATFLHKCILSVRQKHDEQPKQHTSTSSWLAHIDTDEYIVVNPRIRARSPKAMQGFYPSRPDASSVMNFLESMFLNFPKRLSRTCLAMPSVLFGTIEDGRDDMIENSSNHSVIPIGWNVTRFETLRWKYHAAFNDTISGLQKTIMDVSVIRSDDMIFHRHAHSIHRPSNESCRQMKLRPDFDAIRLYPLTINHYVGSYERYRGRDDVRRNEQVYRKKASVRDGGKDSKEWMAGWLGSFIQTHGKDRVSLVLQDYVAGAS